MYDAKGQSIEQISPSGKKSQTVFDPLGRPTQQILAPGTPLASTTTTSYDADSLVIAQSDALGKTTSFTYDSRRNRLTVKDALNRLTAFKPDLRGQITETTAPDGVKTSASYDALGRKLSELDGRAALTSFTYRYDGKLLSYTDPNQATYAFAYDTEGQRTSRTYPDNSQEKYAYFADGSLQMLTKPDGTTISHEYDAKSRLTRQTNSSTNEMVNFSYDAKGQLVSAQNAATSLTRSYDSAGRVLGETSRVSSDIASLSDAKTISYSYNPDGLVAQMARPIGYGDSYQYDARNQLSSITSNAFGAPVVSYTRNGRGQITATTQRNGITNVRNYDDAAQLLSTDYFDGQTLISRAAYTYSQAGQRTSLTREIGSPEEFGYDNSRQLTSVTRGTSASQNDSYSYDLNGNRSAASDQNIASPHSYSVNNLNQYTAISGKNLSYDANGNQTTSPQDAGASLKYDWNDRLIQVNATSSTKAQPATSGLAWDEIRYVYDPLGRRLAKTVTENGAFKRATRFIYDGWNVVEERTERQGAPGISKFLFWGEDLSGSMQGAGGVGGLLTQMEKTDTTNWSASYYHYDGNGNVATVSGPFRAIIAKFSYDGFGRTVSQTGAKSGIDINAIPYRFSTKPMELELATSNTTLVPPPVSSGLYYYGYRFYSPNLGRWINRDPIREEGGMNLYGMVGNDGEDRWDVLGLDTGLKEKLARLIFGDCSVDIFKKWDTDMINRNVKGGDKWHHCMANCEVANKCGKDNAKNLSSWKEFNDLLKNRLQNYSFSIFNTKSPRINNPIEMAKDALADIKHNADGYDCKSKESCECCCEKYKVKGLP